LRPHPTQIADNGACAPLGVRGAQKAGFRAARAPPNPRLCLYQLDNVDIKMIGRLTS